MIDTVVPVVRPAGRPGLRIMASFPIACFCCTLVTDLMYSQTADMFWADFSDWLLAAGMIMGVVAAIVGLVDLASDRRRRIQRAGRVWPVMIGSPIALALALLNNFVHSRDAWTSVVPEGLALSGATVLVILVTAGLSAGRDRSIETVRVRS